MGISDYTTFTEVDPNSHVVITDSDTITVTGLHRDENAYVYKDVGAGHFAATGTYYAKLKITAHADGVCFPIAMTDEATREDMGTHWTGRDDACGCYTDNSGWWSAIECSGQDYDADASVLSTGTPYWIKVVRTLALLRCYIYDNAAMGAGDLVGDVQVDIPSGQTYRCAYAVNSFDDGHSAQTITALVEDLDIGESTASVPWHLLFGRTA